jgi:transposase-like protein
VDYPRNWHELLAWFCDEGSCLRYLERLRWGAGFVCRFCGTVGGDWWQMDDGLRRCAACRSETSVTAGTIFAGTRTPLVSWFAVIWYVVNQKQGVSALGLQRVMGFGSYFGARRPGAAGRGVTGKPIVAIAVEDRGVASGRVRMRRIPDVTKATLTDFVVDHIARGAEVRTDGWQGYFDVGRHPFTHVVTNVSASGDPAHVAMPHVHRVASLVQRWLLGTHQGAISHDQLDYYLDEFTFRFNRRRSRHRGLLFYRLLEGAVGTAPHPYKALTSKTAA